MDKFDAVRFIEASFITEEQHNAFRYLLKVWNTDDERTMEEYLENVAPHDHDGNPVGLPRMEDITLPGEK